MVQKEQEWISIPMTVDVPFRFAAGQYMTKKLFEAIMKRMGIRITARRVTKYIPFLGQGISASISFGAMKIVTNSHINDCYEVAKNLIEMNKSK